MIENMSTESVNAQKIIYDTMKVKQIIEELPSKIQKTEDKNPEGSTTCELEKSKERSDEPDQRCQYNKD